LSHDVAEAKPDVVHITTPPAGHRQVETMDQDPFIVGETEVKVQGMLLRFARIEGDKYEFLDDPQQLIEQLRRCGRRVDLFTFMQRITEPEPKYCYPMEWDNLAAVPISTFDHWWTRQVDAKTRNMVRKAEKKGVEIREAPFDDDFVRGISQIYNETPVRQGRHFRHYGKSIEDVRKEEGTFRDRSVFLGAFFERRMIGFVKLVSDSTATQAGLMNILSMIKHRDKAPTNALLAEAVRSCALRRIPYLVYSNFAYGKKQTDSLSDFKKSNGFRQVDLPRYYVPLTPLGWLALRLRLHQRWIDRLPEPIVARARELRSLWYARKLQASTKAS
jgi:hypothetical protein